MHGSLTRARGHLTACQLLSVMVLMVYLSPSFLSFFFFFIIVQSSLPTVLCHAPEKDYIFLAQLDNDAIDTGPGASGDHDCQPHILQL